MVERINSYPQLDNYSLLKGLGHGKYAKVKLGRNNETKKFVAIKIFKKT